MSQAASTGALNRKFSNAVARLFQGRELGTRGHSVVFNLLSAIEEAGLRRAAPHEIVELLSGSKAALFRALLRNFPSDLEAKVVTLKILNLCLAKYHFSRKDTTLLSRPAGIVVDPANACNLACPGCVHSANAKALKLFEWGPGLLSRSCATSFLKRYGAHAIHATFCNYGEPLVNPDTPIFIATAKRYGLRTLLSTNLALPRFDADGYVESGLDYMVLSIDGATQPVYERFRKKGDLELVYANVRKLVEAKRRFKASTPIIAWRYLAFEHNAHEVPAALEKAAALGVDQFRVDPAWDVSWDDPGIRPAGIRPMVKEFNSGSAAALVENWEKWRLRLDADTIEREFEEYCASPVVPDTPPSEASGGSHSGKTCEWLYKNLTMDGAGKIFPCCCSPRARADLHFAQFEGSDSGQTPADDVFNSSKHRLARLFFADPRRYEQSRDAGGFGRGPYCARCEWEKTADPQSDQIEVYFSAAGRTPLDRESVTLLSSW